MVQLGYTALVMALFAGAYAVLVDLLGSWRRDQALLKSACRATWVSFLCLTAASVVLLTLLVRGDFSVTYVADHTAKALPLAYKISAFWAGASGSLLLWLWIQTGLVVLVFSGLGQASAVFSAAGRVMANFVAVFFLLILILDKNPFAVSLITPQDGAGLNPLLQHPAMALHPPTLFVGYAAFIIPFAWAFASLKHGRAEELPPLLAQAQKWIVWAWLFLTVGIVLGAWWAYEELGWGGYWAWDPVENSSLLPWLTATALLHCSRTYQRNTVIAVWMMVLSLLTYSLCIFGTFLTRYGLVSSVHAFPEPGLGILFLVLLAHLWVIAAVLLVRAALAKRLSIGRSSYAGHRFISWNNWLLILLTVVIFVGTLFPFFSGLLSSRQISLKPEYFTRITAPFGLTLLLLLAVCPHLLYRGLRKHYRVIGALVAVLVAGGCWWITGSLAWATLVLCAFAGVNLVADFVVRWRAGTRAAPSSGFRPARLRWYGARIVHAGMILAFVGIAGSGFSQEKQATLQPGDSTTLGGFTLRYRGLTADHGPNFTRVIADIAVLKAAGPQVLEVTLAGPESSGGSAAIESGASGQGEVTIAELKPSVAVYSGSGKRTSEVDIRRTLAGDLYLALTDVDSTNRRINLNIMIKPLINWLWLGGILCVMGSGLVLVSLYRR